MINKGNNWSGGTNSILFAINVTLSGYQLSRHVIAPIGQLHDDVILLQLPESFSLLFSCAN